jgi:hypothetical protein
MVKLMPSARRICADDIYYSNHQHDLAQTHHIVTTSSARKLIFPGYFSFQPFNNQVTMHALTAGCIRQRDKQALPFPLYHVLQSVDVSSNSVRCYNFVRNH